MKKKISKVLVIILVFTSMLSLAACNPGGGGGSGGGSGFETSIFDVKFETKGGTIIPTQRVSYGKYAMEPTVAPTKYGYKFVGWQDADDKTFVFDSTQIFKNTTVNAVWEAGEYKNTLSLYDAKHTQSNVKFVEIKDKVETPITEFKFLTGEKKEKLDVPTTTCVDSDPNIGEDYFVYWYYVTVKDGVTTEHPITTWAAKPMPVATPTEADEEELTKPKISFLNGYSPTALEGKTIYAKWHSNLTGFNIEFDKNLNGGDENEVTEFPNGVTVKKDGDKVKAFTPKPVRTGYDFEGWYYNVPKVDAKGKPVYDKDGNQIIDKVDFIFDDGIAKEPTVITKELIDKSEQDTSTPNAGEEQKPNRLMLYAKWSPRIELNSVEDFKALYNLDGIKKEELRNAKIYLKTDISLSGTLAPLFADESKPFLGTFDGGKYDAGAVTGNYKITLDSVGFGVGVMQSLFGASNGTIKNLDVDAGTIKINPATVEDAKGAKMDAPEIYASPIVSKSKGTVTNCNVTNLTFATAEGVKSNIVVGGIAAFNENKDILNCTVTYAETKQTLAAEYVTFGGIVGKSSGTITGCTVKNLKIDVTANGESKNNNIGGIVGYADGGKISQCIFDKVDITCTSTKAPDTNVGGLAGSASGFGSKILITECFGSGKITVTAKGAVAGGLVGQSNADITNCYVSGMAVSATSEISWAKAGGLVGYVNGAGSRNVRISQCYTGENVNVSVTTTGATALTMAGGLVGDVTYLDLTRSFSMSNVSVSASKETTEKASLGYVVGHFAIKPGDGDKLNLYYSEEASLKLNDVEYAHEPDTDPNFPTVERGEKNKIEDFKEGKWLEEKLSMKTDLNEADVAEDKKTSIWHVVTGEGVQRELPTLRFVTKNK